MNGKLNELEIESTCVYRHLETSTKRITVEQGGTRSGKTVNILIWIIFSYCSKNKNQGKVISIVRKTSTSIRGTAMRDFIDILTNYGLYSEKIHNKSDSEFMVYGNLVEFIGCDQPQKMRGRKRHLLFVNEANELSFEDWFQLNIRTIEKRIIDYNPSFEYHWIYDDILTRDDAELYITTYLDNPFLTADQIDEIERLKRIGGFHWQVYGLGERGKHPNVVFSFTVDQDLPKDGAGNITCKKLGTGLDWGFTNDPTACLDVYRQGDDLYLKLNFYKHGLTNADISDQLKAINFIKNDSIYCDSAEPKSVEELRRLGWKAVSADKGKGSVQFSIDLAQRFRIHLMAYDLELIKEFNNYLYKTDQAGKPTNEPIDLFNHGIDAFRYVLLMTLAKATGKYLLN